MKNRLKLFWNSVAYTILRPILGAPSEGEDIDIYASKMLTRFNWIHRFIFPRFFSKTRVDQDSLAEVKQVISGSIPIYVTTYIGQLEYNFFNYLFLNESLPLAEYANGLTNWQWMPARLARHTKIARLRKKLDCGGMVPHPVSSGHVENLIREGKSVLVRLRTTRIHDDLFWEIPEEDIVRALISIQKKMDRPLILIPQQFLWAKRPKRARRSIIDWAFGERENPGHLRKIILFWRNYKSHAVVQFGESLNLKDFIEAHPAISDEEMAKILRSTLLAQIRQERKRITGPALKPRGWMIENTVEAELVQREIYTISAEKKKDVEDLKLLALRYAKEIAADINYTYIEYGNRLMNWTFNTMYDGIQYNQEGLARVKKFAERFPIVFVPNHRSHIDYLLISNLLYSNDISVPHVAAGINLAFWPMGKFLRRCGGFFIRRSFADNPLYRVVFESYLRLLLQEGYCQEFFIEGGRSRTGKLRQPRMGMLATLTQAMIEKSAADLFFVPTSITYDQVVEESIYVDESAGKDKAKERFADILKLRKYLKRRYGKIYVNFGRPISFSEAASSVESAEDQNQLRAKIVEKIAFDIMNSLNMNAVVTPSALVATALLMEDKRGITSQQLLGNTKLVRAYLEFMQIQLSNALVSEPDRSIQDVICRLASQKIIEPHQDFDPVYYAVPEEKRGTLDFQKNAIVHFLLPAAYVAASLKALLKGGRATFRAEELDAKLEFLKGLFICEFAAHTGLIKKETTDRTLEFLAEKEIIKFHAGKSEIAVTALGTDSLGSLKGIIKNLLDSYKIAHYTCSKIPPGKSMGEKGLIKTMLHFGQHLLLLGQINRPEAITQPTFENAIRLFKSLGFLTEEAADKESKEKVEYRWNRSNPALEELQQELELFS